MKQTRLNIVTKTEKYPIIIGSNLTSSVLKIFKSKKISYNFCGVMGGPVQSEQGILGGIYGGKKSNFSKEHPSSKSICFSGLIVTTRNS